MTHETQVQTKRKEWNHNHWRSALLLKTLSLQITANESFLWFLIFIFLFFCFLLYKIVSRGRNIEIIFPVQQYISSCYRSNSPSPQQRQDSSLLIWRSLARFITPPLFDVMPPTTPQPSDMNFAPQKESNFECFVDPLPFPLAPSSFPE